MKYKASAAISRYKGHVCYYPIIKFFSPAVSDCYWLNTQCTSRYSELKMATEYIKNIGV